MGIIDVRNRTENWKTARAFAPFLENEEARFRLANHVTRNAHGELDCSPDEVKLELFWKGVRDYLQLKDEENPRSRNETREGRYAKVLIEAYKHRFKPLRDDIIKFASPALGKEWHYKADNEETRRKLFNNLQGTEMDIILETPEYLFIGEAKDESNLGASGTLVLVHQLIRQYVTARVLLDFSGNTKKKAALFAVVSNRRSFLNTHQVKFVKNQGWLCSENVLTWDEVKVLAR